MGKVVYIACTLVMISTWQENTALNNDSNAFRALYLHLMPGLPKFAASFLKDSFAGIAVVFAALWGNRSERMRINQNSIE